MNPNSLYPLLRLDHLNGFVVMAIALFSVLTLVYSWRFMKGAPRLFQYYSCLVLTAVASVAAALSNHLVILALFWGFLGLTLYLLINAGDRNANTVAKKSLVVVGGADALMLLGIAIIYYLTGTFQMDKIKIPLDSVLPYVAYLCIAVGCFAKAGAMPFHSWIPDCAQSAPVPVVAFLPASLDKLLGIYLLARISLNLFVMNPAMNMLLMLVGAFTIIAAVMMALVQHNMKRLLGYHAVSQVGYMILGIGTGNPVGIAGGLFHMLNNAVYKSCLFFSAGNAEYRAKTAELNELGGLAKLMPITYISFMIASFSISGVPPFNGFVSKWLIYQGLIQHISENQSALAIGFSVFCLIAAMFGSGLTLASFMKLLHAVFLGSRANSAKVKNIEEVLPSMWVPVVILAGICVLFGVFAFVLPLKYFIFPAVSAYQPINTESLSGIWSPVLATWLIILGLIFGFIIFKLTKLKASLRQDIPFVGGELAQPKEENAVTGIDFYNTIKEIGFLRAIYAKAENGCFDIYERGRQFIRISGVFQNLHNGVLPSYLVWVLLGMVGLFLIFLR
jgi:formate hydrogenlyase subunit 3/multisubunit Na+/H+ antiporter MnhD subunit